MIDAYRKAAPEVTGMHAVIPAAGRGSRLEGLTGSQPKGLVSIADRPLLAWVFERAVEAGADALVVMIGYKGAQIVKRFGDSFRDIPITYVHQREQCGLGHAVLQAEIHVDGTFLMLNGDNVFVESLTPVVEVADREDVDAVLAVEDVSPDEATTTGVLQFEDDDVTGIVEKPTDPPSTLVTTGCYVLPEAVFEACKLLRPSAEGEYQLSEAVGLLARAGYNIATVRLGERVNVNRPADIERAGDLVRPESE
ncbi:sugar phosphate nucleotidyltransferase [Halobacterium salinarum]|uniref:sugar phosphate nucleotidyltransferase n=1 Tax=Halobacterium salinarum TaxID=2242 RepID=UPI002554D097|nr:sugar phosphate nucleotidyltransferase [Halobacterium salinarum]MDL0138934.1 sugar phosphate nucleotidyltransferase [Halobacterium salinarum]